MAKRNYAELALRNRDALEQFAQEHLGVGFETAADARYRNECLIRIFERHGHKMPPYQAIKDCTADEPCGSEACLRCSRWMRIADCREYTGILDEMGANGALLFTVSVVPKGSVMTGAKLMAYDLDKACARHSQAYRRHSQEQGFRSFLRVAVDICYDAKADRYRLHWHGVVAIWAEDCLKAKKKLRTALKRSFCPLKKGRKLKIKPVILKRIHDLPCWLTYMQKALFSEGGMGKFKNQGTLLSGAAEIPIRVFLSRISHRRRFLEVNTHREVY